MKRIAWMISGVALLLLVPTFSNAFDNLIRNPGFEARFSFKERKLPDWQFNTGKTAPTYTIDKTTAHGGQNSLKMTASKFKGAVSSGAVVVSNSFSVKPGESINYSLWIRVGRDYEGAPILTFLQFYDETGTKLIQGDPTYYGTRSIYTFAKPDEWQKLYHDNYRVPEGAALAILEFASFGFTAGTIWIDDAEAYITEPTTYLPSSIYKIDFGTVDSAVFPSFTQGTDQEAYDGRRDYGWQTAIENGYKGYTRAPLTQPLRKPDDLCNDFIYASDASFTVPLANGDYIVYLITGDILNQLGPNSKEGYSITANGGAVSYSPSLSDEDFQKKYFSFYKNDWEKDHDIWDIYIAPLFPVHKFTVRITDNHLVLNFINTPVNMLAVYDARIPEDVIEGEWAALEKERKRLFPIKEIEHEYGVQESAGTSDKGYLLYKRNYLEEIYPDTIPKRKEITDELNVVASGNEYEPVTFGIYALEDLKNIKINVTDLKTDKGVSLKKENIEINPVRFMEVAIGLDYKLMPTSLRKNWPINISAEKSKWVWLTIHIPKGQKEGIYKGKVTVRPEGAPASELALNLEVLPYNLKDRVTGKNYVIAVTGPPTVKGVLQKTDKGAKAYFNNLKAHGMETIYLKALALGAGGTIDGSGDLVDLPVPNYVEAVKAYKDFGFSEGTILINPGWDIIETVNNLTASKVDTADPIATQTPAFEKAIRQAIKIMNEKLKIENGPDVYFMFTQSDSNPDMAKEFFKAKWAKDVGAKVWVQNCGHNAIAQLIESTEPPIDMMIFGIPLLPLEDVLEGLIKSAHDNDKIIGYSNIGLGVFHRVVFAEKKNGTGAHRFFWGWWFWKTGADAQSNEFFTFPTGQPYNPFDGNWDDPNAGDFSSVVFPTPDGDYESSLHYEWMREGRDDYRYIELLEDTIDEAKKAKDEKVVKKAKEAENFLKGKKDEIETDIGLYLQTEPLWAIDQYGKDRTTIIGYLKDLYDLMHGKKDKDTSPPPDENPPDENESPDQSFAGGGGCHCNMIATADSTTRAIAPTLILWWMMFFAPVALIGTIRAAKKKVN